MLQTQHSHELQVSDMLMATEFFLQRGTLGLLAVWRDNSNMGRLSGPTVVKTEG